MAEDAKKLTVNGCEVEFTNERNLLEVIRKAGIDIPTFCYVSELSVYGACRMCLCEVEDKTGRKTIMAACSTAPAEGMKIVTETAQIRKMRKVAVELLLANHARDCQTCNRNMNCSLQALANKMGVDTVRYARAEKTAPIDDSSVSIVRDPNKCILCGNCVRACRELQGVGAIDFEKRGSNAVVAPAFGGKMADSTCVNCGQCAAVCPTGAITVKQNISEVWDALYDSSKTVAVQIAPSVRMALGEEFGLPPGTNVEGKMVAALRLMGFKHVYDTDFSADMTIWEEATEFKNRVLNGGVLPMFTSCCPAWIKYAETFHPEILPNVSTCRSPQAMFGSVCKKVLPKQLGCEQKDLFLVSIMPCTAKKFEAKLEKFQEEDGTPEVDVVITTSELATMIRSMGIDLARLEPADFDLPLGFGTSAGLIFGASGGVMEAALRYAAEDLTGEKLKDINFTAVRGMDELKTASVTLNVNGKPLEVKVAVVYGLAKAGEVIEKIKSGELDVHFVEVMACPGGCISGGGQPIGATRAKRAARQAGTYKSDAEAKYQKSQDNFEVAKCYEESIGGGPNSHEAHHMLHTCYVDRVPQFEARYPMMKGTAANRVTLVVEVGKGACNDCASKLVDAVMSYAKEKYADSVDVFVAFAAEEKETFRVMVGNQAVLVAQPEDVANVQSALDAAVAAL